MKRPAYFLFLLAALMIFPMQVSWADTITVNTTLDEYGGGNDCSLREAVQSFNPPVGDFGGCTIVNDPNPQTIVFSNPAATYQLTIPTAAGPIDDNSAGDIDICASLQIVGGGQGVTIIEAAFPDMMMDPDRVFHVVDPNQNCMVIPSSPPTGAGPQRTVLFQGLTIRNGRAALTTRHGAVGGGGILNDGAVVGVDDSEITNNTADNALLAAAPVPARGGGILNFGTLLVTASNVHDNDVLSVDPLFTPAKGGGMALIEAGDFFQCVTLVGTTNINGNTVDNGSGGGVSNENCRVVGIALSALYDNHVTGSDGSPQTGPIDYGSGGAIATFYSPSGGSCSNCILNVLDSTLSGNSAVKHGGGIAMADENSAAQNSVQFNSSTVASNVADSDSSGNGDGGGFFLSRIFPIGSVFAFQNTIWADNTGFMGPDGFDENPAVDPTSFGYNLLRDPTGANVTPAVGDLFGGGVDPDLAPLANNGGLTMTRALRVNSDAIDMANPAGCEDAIASGNFLPFDQRDDPFNRVEPGSVGAVPRCDIGAYEFQIVEIATQKQVSDAVVNVGDNFTYTIIITNNGPGQATGVMINDPLPAQVSFVSFGNISQGNCNEAGGVVTCDLGNMAVGDVATVEVNVQAVAESNAVTNTATVTTNETEPQNPEATNQIIGGICVTGSGPIWNTIRPGCANCSLNPHAFSLGFWRDYGPYLILGIVVAAVLAFRRKKVRG